MKGNTMTAPTTGQPRSDADELMFGGGAKSASFLNPGDSCIGLIVAEPRKIQATDFQTGKPKVWDNGDPVWRLRVTVQTDQRDPTDDDDDGRRAIYIGGSRKPESGSKLAATIAAVKAAGRQLEVGGQFGIRFTHATPSEKGGSDTKHYEARYVPPAGDAAAMLAPEQPQAAPQAPPTPATAPVAAPATQQAWPVAPAPQAAPQADPWVGTATQVTGQQPLPVVDQEALKLAGILKSNGVDAETILRQYPQLTAADVASLPPF